MKDHHTFIDRNYLIYLACTEPDLNEDDREYLDRHGIKSSLLTPDVPDWLKKWTSLTLRFCEYENSSITSHLKEIYSNYTDLQCELEAKNILSNRISNIAITLDKVKHWLKMMGTKEAPLRVLSFREMLERMWSSSENSFKKSLFDLVYHKLEDSQLKEEIVAKIFIIYDIHVDSSKTEQECKDNYLRIMDYLREISWIIRRIKSKVIHTEALADTLYLYSYIENYFTPNENYDKVIGEEVWVRKCEVTTDPRNRGGEHNPFLTDEERIVHKGQKVYDSMYIWGQLSGWFKQSVDKPNASLSADKRGTLWYPDLESFILQKQLKKSRRPKQKKKNNDYTYNVDEVSEGDGCKRRRRAKSRGKKSAASANVSSMNEDFDDNDKVEESKTPNPFLKDTDLPKIPIMNTEEEEDTDFDEMYSYPHKKYP